MCIRFIGERFAKFTPKFIRWQNDSLALISASFLSIISIQNSFISLCFPLLKDTVQKQQLVALAQTEIVAKLIVSHQANFLAVPLIQFISLCAWH